MWLLKVMRGEPVVQIKRVTDPMTKVERLVEYEHYADFETRVDAAKAAAPYFAPKLGLQVVRADPGLLPPSQLTDEQLEAQMRAFCLEFGVQDLLGLDDNVVDVEAKTVEPCKSPPSKRSPRKTKPGSSSS